MISAWCYPRRIFRRPAKLFAPAFVLQQIGLIRFALNLAASSLLDQTHWKMARCLAAPPLCIETWSFSSQFNSAEIDSVLPLPPLCFELRSLHFSFNSKLTSSVLPLPPSLNRLAKFCFPINLKRMVRAVRKVGKSYFTKALRIFVHVCAKEFQPSRQLPFSGSANADFCTLFRNEREYGLRTEVRQDALICYGRIECLSKLRSRHALSGG
jgi:hypothetical protein